MSYPFIFDDAEKSSVSRTILTYPRQNLHNKEEEKILQRVSVWYQPKTLWKLS